MDSVIEVRIVPGHGTIMQIEDGSARDDKSAANESGCVVDNHDIASIHDRLVRVDAAAIAITVATGRGCARIDDHILQRNRAQLVVAVIPGVEDSAANR